MIGDSPEQSNYVIVGSKPMMSYVVACLTLFNEGVPGVVLRARGRNISNAVDTAEMLRRVFIRDAHIKSIKIGTDARAESEGNVSTIDIAITPR